MARKSNPSSSHASGPAQPDSHGGAVMRELLQERPPALVDITDLFAQYGCGPIPLTGMDDALYERHLVFDNVLRAARSPARSSTTASSTSTSPTAGESSSRPSRFWSVS